MALVFAGIDPDTGGDNCPAVFVDDETGDLIFQGWTVSDPKMLADVAKHSPHRGQRVGNQAPGADAGDHPGGAQWPRCHRSAS